MPGTVMVGCKMPNGVILNLDRYEVEGPNRVARLIPDDRTVKLKGVAVPFGTPAILIGCYAMTEVDADFWAAWIKANAKSSLIVDKLIICDAKPEKAADMAREHDAVPQQFPPGKLASAGVQTAVAA